MAYATASRAETLRQFQAEIRAVDLKVDENFQGVLRAAQGLLEMSDQEIADALSVSRPTVNRWMNGKNLPYNAMRKPVFSWIDAQLSARIKRIEASARSYSASSSSGFAPRFERMAAKSRE
jgi:transcriptional regulator with XRE-family HTH domain